MRKELWKTACELALTEEELGELEFIPAVSGSPYEEVVQVSGKTVTVNPYIRYGNQLKALLSDEAFMRSREGQLLFQEAIRILLDIERVQGIDKDYFIKKWLEEEIIDKHFGEEIAQFYQKMTVQEQKRTLENLQFFYQHKQTVTSFVKEVVTLFPHSLLFQKKSDTRQIYIYVGMPKSKETEWKIERCKELFLPMETAVHIAWEQEFFLTDMQPLESIGKHMA